MTHAAKQKSAGWSKARSEKKEEMKAQRAEMLREGLAVRQQAEQPEVDAKLQDQRERLGQVEGVVFAKGTSGQIRVEPGWVTLHRKGFSAAIMQGSAKGDKRIPIASISAVQMKKPGLSAGYIQLIFSGSHDSTGGAIAAMSDENSVGFQKHALPAFERVRDEIERQITARHAPAVAPAPATAQSVADEIRDLAALRDEGLVTGEEFEARKRSLLGL